MISIGAEIAAEIVSEIVSETGSETGSAIDWFVKRDTKSTAHSARSSGDCIVFLHTHTRVM
jgi:hypothetical protein